MSHYKSVNQRDIILRHTLIQYHYYPEYATERSLILVQFYSFYVPFLLNTVPSRPKPLNKNTPGYVFNRFFGTVTFILGPVEIDPEDEREKDHMSFQFLEKTSSSQHTSQGRKGWGFFDPTTPLQPFPHCARAGGTFPSGPKNVYQHLTMSSVRSGSMFSAGHAPRPCPCVEESVRARARACARARAR